MPPASRAFISRDAGKSYPQELEQRLTELREEIRSAFPDTPHERCLLRDEVLEEFIQKRPKAREWFRKVSEQTRTSIDSKQVGRYLDRIFQTIVDCA
jgi:hypothetical protein